VKEPDLEKLIDKRFELGVRRAWFGGWSLTTPFPAKIRLASVKQFLNEMMEKAGAHEARRSYDNEMPFEEKMWSYEFKLRRPAPSEWHIAVYFGQERVAISPLLEEPINQALEARLRELTAGANETDRAVD
jgi:hypothetical protein